MKKNILYSGGRSQKPDDDSLKRYAGTGHCQNILSAHYSNNGYNVRIINYQQSKKGIKLVYIIYIVTTDT